jgi:Uma2 family endonuclease
LFNFVENNEIMSEAIFASKPKKTPAEPRKVSLEAYFRAEEKSFEKNEYHNGIIIKMAGGTYNHRSLSLKVGAVLLNFVESNDLSFRVNGSDLKIRIEEYNKIVYPDALVISEGPIFFNDRKDTITNPLLIVEVLSNSTKNYDKTDKFEMYRSLASFKEYVLIHQDRKHVSVYSKQPDATWILRDYDGDNATAILYHIANCPLPLKQLYRGLIL